ncbi:hypothetical protein GAO09_22995 [Rhizobiales bacterium RZME27]|uniref:Cysteine rich repeat-containing protein n=1 Tax=Endobacterium cereale TaxID=2663029 RepID=A0A6A8AI42_9HYPH|nr:cysteine rich repeat-containing protein [Endobacterium cereale]MEB2845465.1 cysteine rich repeat-containing protein [Endobacterium cereale]MQY48906.1 hypothetical protein [Endobacterium cereale]
MFRKALTIALLLFAGAAHAQQAGQAQMQAAREICAPDIQKLCPGISPGGGRLKACIREHASEFSKPCTDAMKNARAARNP